MDYVPIKIGATFNSNPNSRILDYSVNKKEKFFGPDEWTCSINVRGGQHIFGFGQSENEAISGAIENWELEFFDSQNEDVDDSKNEKDIIVHTNDNKYFSVSNVYSIFSNISTNIDLKETHDGNLLLDVYRNDNLTFKFVCKFIIDSVDYCWSGKYFYVIGKNKNITLSYTNERNTEIVWGKLVIDEDDCVRFEMSVLLQYARKELLTKATIIFLEECKNELELIDKI